MAKSYIATLTHTSEGVENTENFILTDVPASLSGNTILCALLLCIWDNETNIQDTLDQLHEDDDVGAEIQRLENDFNCVHAQVYDRNSDVYAVEFIDVLTDEEIKAYQVLQPRLSIPCYTFFIFDVMFDFALKTKLHHGDESIDLLENSNPLIYKLMNFYIEKLNDGAEQFDDAWLEEINTLLNA